MMRLRMIILSCVCVSLVSSQLTASTVYFLPGDAYFRTYLTENFLNRQSVDQPITFQYGPTTAYFCGYVGTPQLKFANKKGEFLKQLQLAYNVIRSRYPKKVILHQEYKPVKRSDGSVELQKKGAPSQTEANRLHVFVYNLDYDLTNHHLLHLYNENWKQECVVKERDPHEIVEGYDIQVESLKRGDQVAPLKVKRIGSPNEQAHLVASAELMLVIVPDKKWLEQIARCKTAKPNLKLNENTKRTSMPEIYILKPDGLYHRTLEGDKWSDEEKITFELLTKPKPGFF